MVGRPGRPQAAFTSGELDQLLYERTELKYYGTGLRRAENLAITPQGGFRARDGLRDVGATAGNMRRYFPFDASNGVAYDLLFRPGLFEVWGEAGMLLAPVAIIGLTEAMLPEMTVAQALDTMLVFHRDLVSKRIKHLGPTSWVVDDLPFENLPLYDYGADINGDPYTNGVAAVWTLEFVGLADADGAGTDDVLGIFTLTVSRQETTAITYNGTMSSLAPTVEAALLALPNVSAGLTVAAGTGDKLVVTFSGAGNEGDGWAVNGRVINKTDAAIIAAKTTEGVAPGEAVISADRGWPQCGCFYTQRLLVGGFKALQNAWLFSASGDYYNYDDRLTEANGPALVPMDVAGGEGIEHIVASRNLLFFSNKAEYWLAERALSKVTAPNHVQSSTHGTRRGVAPVQNEGSAIFVHDSGSVAGEYRYTDIEGNFVATDITLLAPHLVVDVTGTAIQKADHSTKGNQLFLVQSDGQARAATILREQEVMAFSRLSSRDGLFIAAAVNGRNEAGFIVERPAGRRLERLEAGLLLDEAEDFAFDPPSGTIAGLNRFIGRQVWVIGDGQVFGPFTVSGAGSVTLPAAVAAATVGSWLPPVAQTLPLSRVIGPDLVLKRKARIHSVTLSLIDTTSIAVSSNGKPLRDVDLVRWGAPANLPELSRGFSGQLSVRGLTGFKFDPYVTISQLRPGRLQVRSITVEAQL